MWVIWGIVGTRGIWGMVCGVYVVWSMVGKRGETIHSAARSCPVVSTVTTTVTLNLNPLSAHTCSRRKNT